MCFLAAFEALGSISLKERQKMDVSKASDPTLHVFQQDGEWHWGITVERPTGGMKVVAYSDEGFDSEEEAREEGAHVLRSEDWRSRQSFGRSERRQGCP
jgi:hypothetical protein